MKGKKSILCAAISMLVAANLTGCKAENQNKYKVSEEKTKYYSVNIDGDYVYYGEDNSELSKIEEFTKQFITGLNVRDYTTQSFNSPDEWYVKSIADSYKASGRQNVIFKGMMDNDLIVEVNDISIDEIQLYTLNGQDAACVKGEYISTYLNSKQEYIESLGLKVNTKYKRTISLFLQVEDGMWKAVSTEQGTREEVK